MTAALGTLVVDDPGVAALRIPVDRMVDGPVPDAAGSHVPHEGLEGVDVACRIARQFDVRDVTAVGEGVIRSLNADLVRSTDVVPDRHVEAVGVVLPVGDSRDRPVTLTIHPHESPRQSLRRCGQGREVQPGALGRLVHPLSQVADDP